MQAGVVVFLVVIALLGGFGLGWLGGRHYLRLAAPGGGKEDPLLREAEAEVEALLEAVPPGEQKKRLLPPPNLQKHPRLTEMQRRAIAGLLNDGFSSHRIMLMQVESVEPPQRGNPSRGYLWKGRYFSSTGRPCFDDAGKWGEPLEISGSTWAYLRRVIESRPDREHSWAFQYANGDRVDHADVITCSGEES